MAGTVGTFKQDHHVVFGVALTAVGLFGVIGSVTGRLAVMLAALFDPGALIDSPGSSGLGIGLLPAPLVGTAPSDVPAPGTDTSAPSTNPSGAASEATGAGQSGASSAASGGSSSSIWTDIGRAFGGGGSTPIEVPVP